MQGEQLVAGVLAAIDLIVKGIQAASQSPRHESPIVAFLTPLYKLVDKSCRKHCLNCRYTFLVYNGSVHYWHISRILQRDGLRAHLIASQQIVVEAVRKLPGKQDWLARLLLQLALALLEVMLLPVACSS